jgi:hypothetical protein
MLVAALPHSCHGARLDTARVRIDVHHSDEAIRQELLGYTPLGSDAAAVLAFVRLRLSSEGIASNIGLQKFFRPAISSLLGHYRTGLFSQECVEAQWEFDDGRKLRAITFRRFPYSGGWFRPSDFIPQVQIDLYQSDENIRRQLLTFTPIGTSGLVVGKFLATRLYIQAAANGKVLTGRLGRAVILGEYIDKTTGLRYSVRANWISDARDRLSDIQVSRVRVKNGRR